MYKDMKDVSKWMQLAEGMEDDSKDIYQKKPEPKYKKRGEINSDVNLVLNPKKKFL